MEGGCSGGMMMMAMGEDHNNGFSMMMNMITPSNNSTTNTLFLPPPFAVPFMEDNNYVNQQDINTKSSTNTSDSLLRAKIMAHPQYPRLLAAYVSCQKVGAPPEVVARLEEACGGARWGGGGSSTADTFGEDPALDQFMEAYCEMLTKYEQELTKPFTDALLFLSKIESQFRDLALSSSHATECGTSMGQQGTSEGGDANHNYIDGPSQSHDGELKCRLLQKYSGYLGNLKQEFLKRKKKGKLPMEARQQLLDWWRHHYKWPYPSEAQKLALAQSTGLDQKQINNWFINQRKRHWKPTEDMQFVMAHPNGYIDSTGSMMMGNHLYHAGCSSSTLL
ncbi:hypothetical protein Nepgr_000542 [Nepenthes gracilis]|uniref:Uncharacterized protein n=1 Tax=Nepenthes gracilis TaxID=150966 RepID=A0AAD3P5G1_NEPGR|nr:hypothetical protein Nepgr_000542 [Nepenthes gracilis]